MPCTTLAGVRVLATFTIGHEAPTEYRPSFATASIEYAASACFHPPLAAVRHGPFTRALVPCLQAFAEPKPPLRLTPAVILGEWKRNRFASEQNSENYAILQEQSQAFATPAAVAQRHTNKANATALVLLELGTRDRHPRTALPFSAVHLPHQRRAHASHRQDRTKHAKSHEQSHSRTAPAASCATEHKQTHRATAMQTSAHSPPGSGTHRVSTATRLPT